MNLNNLEAALFYDKVFVKGLAKISLPLKTCEFLSDFVPILHINSNVTIVTKINGAPFLKITGPVFLSSKKLMRIQPITLALYENAEKHYEIPVNVNAQKVKSHIFSSDSYQPCSIVRCSAERLTLSGDFTPDRTDSKLEILVGAPIFSDETSIELAFENKGMLFGKSSKVKKGGKYVYQITNIDKKSKHELLRYIRRQSIMQLAKAMK